MSTFRGHAVLVGSLLLLVASAANAQLPGNLPHSLKDYVVPQAPNINSFLRDKDAAIKLGKALFWDMSVGSDGKIACASCHFNAGADSRSRNQLNPGGLAGDSEFFPGTGPNFQLKAKNHPHTAFADHRDRFSEMTRDNNDVVSSAGTFMLEFLGITPGRVKDDFAEVDDPIFRVEDRITRKVEPRNSPTVIGAVGNIEQFWDGRADFIFNGVTPFGCLDEDAKVLHCKRVDGVDELRTRRIEIPYSSLASQAVGPPLSGFEMSAAGRVWADIGRKMLAIRPLRQQLVSKTDSVLGDCSRFPAKGLTVRYERMIKDAFKGRWWRCDDKMVSFDAGGKHVILDMPDRPLVDGEYTMMEANFSLFFGLAIQCYEQTLIPHETRFEEFLTGRVAPTDEELRGMRIFFGSDPANEGIPDGKCVNCHSGPFFSSATIPELGFEEEPGQFEGFIERMESRFGQFLRELRFNSDLENVNARELPMDGWDPRGALVEVIPDNASNPTFTFTLPGVPGDCEDDGFNGFMNPQPFSETFDPLVELTLSVDDNCFIHLDAFARNLPIGTYRFVVDGVTRGTYEAIEPILYDGGFYNIGVRPTEEDILRGADINPGGLPLSWTRQAQQGIDVLKGFEDFDNLMPSPPVSANEGTGVDGAAKTPILLNIALTAPYMHNGGMKSLKEVMRFYNRGGNFHEHNIMNLDPDIVELGLTNADMNAVIAFMETLTDERVLLQKAPFDHPECFIRNGHKGDHNGTVGAQSSITAGDRIFHLPAVGAEGGAPLPKYLEH